MASNGNFKPPESDNNECLHQLLEVTLDGGLGSSHLADCRAKADFAMWGSKMELPILSPATPTGQLNDTTRTHREILLYSKN